MPAVLGLLWSQPSCRQRGSLTVLRLMLGEVALALQTTPHTPRVYGFISWKGK